MIDFTEEITKIEKYILRFTDDVVRSTRSAYFRFSGYIVRVSDHIGTNSSGTFSIIPISKDFYVIHKHSNGCLKMQTYNELKSFIKHVAEYSDMMTAPSIPNWDLAKNESLLTEECEKGKDYIMGINVKEFSEGQLNSVNAILAQVKQKKGMK